MPLVEPPKSCVGCGACCIGLLVEIEPSDYDGPPASMTHKVAGGKVEMKRREDKSCVALDLDTMLCTIYDNRPTICREFGPEDNVACLDRLFEQHQIVRDASADGVERLLKAAAEFALSRGFAPAMRSKTVGEDTEVTIFLKRALKVPDIRMRIRDESLLRMRGALSVATQVREVSQLGALHDWAVQRKHAETAHRPDENIHKRTLVDTWDQVIRHLESLLPHDEPLEGEEQDG